jgi:hypothetical protein
MRRVCQDRRYYSVTVTQYDSTSHCTWCGRAFAASAGLGRKARYCRRSHRQRAFEARRLAARMGLDSGEALVDAEALSRLRDRLYVLESALDDVESDLRGHTGQEEYKRAFQHLYAAAAQLRDGWVEPRAILSRAKAHG